jgi:hypothetical protein
METERDAPVEPIFRDHEPSEEGAPDPDVLPEGAARGGITVPDANDTGMTTPPISGWGEVPADDEVEDG